MRIKNPVKAVDKTVDLDPTSFQNHGLGSGSGTICQVKVPYRKETLSKLLKGPKLEPNPKVSKKAYEQ